MRARGEPALIHAGLMGASLSATSSAAMAVKAQADIGGSNPKAVLLHKPPTKPLIYRPNFSRQDGKAPGNGSAVAS
jgi:hypothetical protein